MKRQLTFLILILLPYVAHGLQVKHLQGNKKVTANISYKSLNRITVADDRILQVFGLSEDFTIETDDNTGQLFIRARTKKPIDLSLITEKQVTLDLRLKVQDIPAETIIIKTNKNKVPAKISLQTSPYTEKMTRLILAMAKDKPIVGFVRTDVNKEVLLWEKIDVKQIQEYLGKDLTGEVYELVNKTPDRIYMTETQFGWQQGIAAVAIKKHALAPKEKTYVYIARHIT